MKRVLVKLAVIVSVICIASSSNAGTVPFLINYQGKLTNANGVGFTETKTIEFNIYDVTTGGTAIWGPQIFTSVSVVNGMFNVILGEKDSAGRLISSAFTSNARYLGIKVGGVEITPRQQILSTPFAIQADNTNLVQGKNLEQHILSILAGDGLSCKDIKEKNSNSQSGVYKIDPDGKGGYDPFPVYCDMTSDGGGWTVIFDANNSINNCGELCSSRGVAGSCDAKRFRITGSFPSAANESLCGAYTGTNNLMMITMVGSKGLNNLNFSQMRYQLTGKCGNQVSEVAVFKAGSVLGQDTEIARGSGTGTLNTLTNTGIDAIHLWQGDSINFCGGSNGCSCNLELKHLSFR